MGVGQRANGGRSTGPEDSMIIPLYQADAFAERPFAGNPAAVCRLERR